MVNEEPTYLSSYSTEDYSKIILGLQFMESRLPLWETILGVYEPLRELTPEEQAALDKRIKHYQRWRPYRRVWYAIRHPWKAHVSWVLEHYGNDDY